MSNDVCAYCGKNVPKSDREHVISRCLYPKGRPVNGKRLTIRSCRACNAGWTDDEAHFRNVLAIASEPNAPRREIWSNALRSFEKVDGTRRLLDVVKLMRQVPGSSDYKVYPAEDERILRVVRKMIRGLSYYHEEYVTPDSLVWTDVLRYAIPQDLLDGMKSFEYDPEIFEYKYALLDSEDIHSAWLLIFYQRIAFIGLVRSQDALQSL